MSGHVFVVNGRLEEVVHDAAIVPTDRGFKVEAHWESLLGGPAEQVRPANWSGGSFGQASNGTQTWFIDVGDTPDLRVGPSGLASRLRDLLQTISTTGLTPAAGRVLPLVVLPLLGVGLGGLNKRRGEVIVALLDVLDKFVGEAAIDVAIVTPSRAVYSAVQHKRRARPPKWGFNSEEEKTATDLGRLAADGHLALLIGAGASIPAGLPSWNELIGTLTKDASPALAERIGELADSPLDQAELLSRASTDGLGDAVAHAMVKAVRPSLAHALLAGLRCREALTTNYDNLYERAVAGSGDRALGSLPATVGAPTDRWLLKMHGSLDDAKSIILTRRDFVQYDARVKPAASVLQAVALTRHMLMVGVSMKDDNVVRLLLEVDAYRNAASPGSSRPFATLLDVSGDRARAELWKGQITWLPLEGALPEAARRLEIFLDAVSMYASQDANWLLDERFAGMLTSSQQRLAARSRDLLRDIERGPGEDDGWAALADALRDFGARTER